MHCALFYLCSILFLWVQVTLHTDTHNLCHILVLLNSFLYCFWYLRLIRVICNNDFSQLHTTKAATHSHFPTHNGTKRVAIKTNETMMKMCPDFSWNLLNAPLFLKRCQVQLNFIMNPFELVPPFNNFFFNTWIASLSVDVCTNR